MPLSLPVRTVAGLLADWLDLRSRGWTSPHSGDAPQRMAHEWSRIIGSMPIRSVRPIDVQRVYLDQDTGKRSAAWLNKEHDRLHAFFSWAVELGLCKNNPVTRAAWPRISAERTSSRSRRHVRITPELLEQILDLAPIRYHRVLVLLFLAGLRIGECLAATWRWVVPDPRDPSAWILAVPGRAESDPGRPDQRKQSRGYAVPLGSRALAILGQRGADDDKIFTEAPKACSFRALLTKIGDKLGIHGLSPHQFRRSCATVLVDLGMPLPAAQQFLGWKCAPKQWLDDLASSYYLGLEGSRARAIQDRLWPTNR